jgi:tetratricopeptide (TPR) repeat protein
MDGATIPVLAVNPLSSGRLALVILCGVFLGGCDSSTECRAASHGDDTERIIDACRREYEETSDPSAGLEYAKALYRSGKDDRTAETVVRRLLETSVRSDALQVLGRIIKRGGRLEEARSAFEQALELHQREGRRGEVAKDEQALALIFKDQSRYAEALVMLDRCIGDARAGRAPRDEGFCHLAAAQTLSRLGYAEAAGDEVEAAEPLLHDQRGIAALHIERGNAHQENGQDAQAVVLFEKALRIAERAALKEMRIRAHINLAYSLAQTGRLDEAARHLDSARELDGSMFAAERMHQEGRIAYHRKEWDRAASLLEQAAPLFDDADEEKTEIAILRARIALIVGELDTAEKWAREAIERVEQIRAAQSAIELRGWALSSRRSPYEILFTVLARAGRSDEALITFDQWYGRTLLDALAGAVQAQGQLTLKDAALQINALRELIPSMTTASLTQGEDPNLVLEAVHSADLFALVVAEGELWRVTATEGRLELTDLGALKPMAQSLDDFIAHPQDKALAEELGALLLPDELVRDTTETLRVALDGNLSRLPVAALRRFGRPLIATRPVVRTQRLSAARCAPPLPPVKRALVMADAQGNLPAARREAQRVARLFRTTALVGKAASSHALLSTQPLDLLHMATHAETKDAGGLLLLDRAVPAFEIFGHRLDVSTVILATCSSALATDSEGANSLVTAFLAGGARHVVATVRPVSDLGAEEITHRFYDAGGAEHPVQALATVQRELAGTDNVDWPYFAVFGQDSCATP